MNFEELPRALGNIIHSITNVINKPLKYTISNTLNAANLPSSGGNVKNERRNAS